MTEWLPGLPQASRSTNRGRAGRLFFLSTEKLGITSQSLQKMMKRHRDGERGRGLGREEGRRDSPSRLRFHGAVV